MIVNKKRLEGVNVYELNHNEPCGTVKNICFSKNKGCIDALVVETLSIIPISKKIPVCKIHKMTTDKIVLKDSLANYNFELLHGDSINENEVVGVKCGEKNVRKIKDVKFDCETGIITDIIVSGSILRKKEKLQVKEFEIKDNIIYIK